MGKEKYDNNLFMVTINGREKQYFTSATRAAMYIGIHCAQLVYNIGKGKTMEDSNGNTYDVSIVDGAKIPYGMINNKR